MITSIWLNEQINEAGGMFPNKKGRGFLAEAVDLIKKTKGAFFDENVRELYEALCLAPQRKGTTEMLSVGETSFPTLLKNRLEIQAVAKYELAPTDLGNCFEKRVSNKRDGKIFQLHVDSNIDTVRPSETYPMASMAETTISYTNRKFGQILKIDEESIRFDDLGAILDAVSEMADDMKIFEEQQRADVLTPDSNFDIDGSTLDFINEANLTGGLTAANIGILMSLAAKIKKPNGNKANVRIDWIKVPVALWILAGQVLGQRFEDPGANLEQRPVGFKFLSNPSLIVSANLDDNSETKFYLTAKGGLVENVVIPTEFRTMRGNLTPEGWKRDIVAEFKIRTMKSWVVKDKRRIFRGNKV